MYFVIDNEANGYWVVTVDAPGNSKFGMDRQEFSMTLKGSGIAGTGVRVIRKDDDYGIIVPPGETCLTAEKDCYDWNSTTGEGTFLWVWDPCCTDGMVLGKLPSKDFCVDVTVHKYLGLEKMVLGDYIVGDRDIEFIDIPLKADAPVQVCGYTCTDFCSEKTTCGACAAHEQCGWCGSTGKCEPKGVQGACAESWTGYGECCGECTAVTTGVCGDCLAVGDGCAYDTKSGACFSGDRDAGFTCRNDPAESVCFDGSGCSPSKNVWVGQCFTDAPTSSPTQSPTTRSPTATPTTGTPTKAPTGPTSSPTMAPTKPDAPTCATEVQVQCNVSALDEFVNATCYNATDYEGFDEPEFSGVCLCDFGNCTVAPALIMGMEPAVLGGVVGGISVLLVAAAVFFCCAAARRRERKKDARNGNRGGRVAVGGESDEEEGRKRAGSNYRHQRLGERGSPDLHQQSPLGNNDGAVLKARTNI